MENLASDLSSVVRQLFPEVDDTLISNKRKRLSSSRKNNSSALREISNHSNHALLSPAFHRTSEKQNHHQPQIISFNYISHEKLWNQEGSLSPHNPLDFLAKISKVSSAKYSTDTDYILIRKGEANNRDDDVFVSLKLMTMEELETTHVMIVPKTRRVAMEKMGRIILGKNFDHAHPRFGPGFWHLVLRSFDNFKNIYVAENDTKRRFDFLFGFTYYLSKYRRWLTHNARGWGGEKMVAGLALRWKHMLKYPLDQIGIDDDFSYPAVIFLLDDFKFTIESVETYGNPSLRFEYI